MRLIPGNDGTLWSEKPIPIQLDFTLFRMAELAPADASLARRQPYQAAVERDYRWLGEAVVKHYHGDDADLGLLMGAALASVSGRRDEPGRHPTQLAQRPDRNRALRIGG